MHDSLHSYCGHGGAEKYLSPQAVEGGGCPSVTMLIGCSSGKFKDCGQFEASSTPLHYLMGGR